MGLYLAPIGPHRGSEVKGKGGVKSALGEVFLRNGRSGGDATGISIWPWSGVKRGLGFDPSGLGPMGLYLALIGPQKGV